MMTVSEELTPVVSLLIVVCIEEECFYLMPDLLPLAMYVASSFTWESVKFN